MGTIDDSGKILDVELALAHVDGDAELLSELAEMFVHDYPRLIHECREAISKADFSVVERTAHTLRGRLAFFGISRTRDQLSDLETMGREHDLAQAETLLARIESAMQPILPEFEPLIREQSR